MANYIQTCPYCGTQLSVNELKVDRTASRCPHCQNIIILLEYGAVIKRFTVALNVIKNLYMMGDIHSA